jgi:hypothetical protein
MMTEPVKPVDIFAEMDSPAMIYAYVHRIHGLDGLQAVLNATVEDQWTKASLTQAADELTQLALDMPALAEAAEAVAAAAANAPEPENPFPEHSANWRNWNRFHHDDFTGFLGGKS